MDTGEFEPWVFVVVYGGFAGQGLALAIAFACHVRARWGWLLGARTGEILTGVPPACGRGRRITSPRSPKLSPRWLS